MPPLYILHSTSLLHETLTLLEALDRTDDIHAILSLDRKHHDPINDIPIQHISILDDLPIEDGPGCELVSAIATPKRKELIEKYESMGFEFPTLIHPMAKVEQYAKVGRSLIVFENVGISRPTTIGDHVFINEFCSIASKTKVGSFCTLYPYVTLNEGAEVGDGCFIGADVTIRPGVKVGDRCYIEARSVVTEDIPDDTYAEGDPCRAGKKSDWQNLFKGSRSYKRI